MQAQLLLKLVLVYLWLLSEYKKKSISIERILTKIRQIVLEKHRKKNQPYHLKIIYGCKAMKNCFEQIIVIKTIVKQVEKKLHILLLLKTIGNACVVP